MIAISARWAHEVELPSDAHSVAVARTFVTDLLHDYGHSALVPDVQLVVSELATNAIVHALSRDWGVHGYAGGGKTVWAEFDT